MCAEVMALIASGAKPVQARALIEKAAAVKRKDVLCLKALGAPEGVVVAARDRVQDAREAAGAGTPSTPGEPAQPAPAPAQVQPQVIVQHVPRLDVEFTGVVVVPYKMDGKPWDGVGAMASPEVLASLAVYTGGASVLAADTVSKLAQGAASHGVDLPDPFGYVTVLIDGTWLGGKLSLVGPQNTNKNTCTPMFTARPGLLGLPDQDGLRLQVTVYDEDIGSYDVVGMAEIPIAELRAARDAGKIVQIPVGDQTANQLLLVGVSVRDSNAVELTPQGYVFE